jgi:tRNA (guanosine-2'-O-)-methyltransferase
MIEEFDRATRQKLTEYLLPFVTDERKNRFDEIIAHRTGHMQLVLEDVYQAHNASAVLRSADCFGIQHIHFIENRNKYRISGEVALGASQWLTVHRHKSTQAAITGLKQKGFRIVATTPHKNDTFIYDFDVKEKFALVFGTEKEGVSRDILDRADAFVKIPMYGFTESFNISVCAALCMHELSRRIKNEVSEPYLSAEEKDGIYLSWLIASIKRCDLLIKDFFTKQAGLSGK